MKKTCYTILLGLLFSMAVSTALGSAIVSGIGTTSGSPALIDLSVSGYDSGILTLEDGGYFNIVDSAGTTRDLEIFCADANTHITVTNISILVQGDNQCALAFTGAGNELLLAGVNTFSSGANAPGIRVEAGTSLTIQNAGTVDGTLNAINTGDSQSGHGAGIGGRHSANAGTIIINSGIINASSHYSGAGIGGGHNASGGTTIINGGTITASSTHYGTGIGSGGFSSNSNITGGTITINGGVVNATAGSYYAAGIGGGLQSAGGTITITGGTVTARGAGYYGTGIGNGAAANLAAGTITTTSTVDITGGTVIAISGNRAAGIGGGYGSDGCDVTISNGAIVYAQGSSNLNTEHDIGKGRLWTPHYAQTVDNSLTISDASTLVFTRYNRIHPSPTLNDDIGYYTDTSFITSVRNVESLTATPWSNALGLYTVAETVTFAANTTDTVSNLPAAQLVYPGQYATVPSTNPSRAGYTFSGWYQETGCTNAWLFTSMPVNNNVTLFAKWIGDAKTITYDPNGGTGSRVDTHQAGTIVTLNDGATFSNTGYVLVGWTIDGVSYRLGDSYTMPIENKIAYAIWAVVTIPQTGDTAFIGLWITLAIALLLCIGYMVIQKHKKQ